MTDQTKDAIERVRRELTLEIDNADDSQFVCDIRIIIAELDRLTKPIEAGEVADAVRNMVEACMCAYEQTKPCVPCRSADLIDRLARENERLVKQQQSMQSWIDHHNTRADAAEARAKRLAEALRDGTAELSSINFDVAAGRWRNHATLAESLSAIIERLNAALNEPKAGTE